MLYFNLGFDLIHGLYEQISTTFTTSLNTKTTAPNQTIRHRRPFTPRLDFSHSIMARYNTTDNVSRLVLNNA